MSIRNSRVCNKILFICLDGYVHYQRYLNMGQPKKGEKKLFRQQAQYIFGQ